MQSLSAKKEALPRSFQKTIEKFSSAAKSYSPGPSRHHFRLWRNIDAWKKALDPLAACTTELKFTELLGFLKNNIIDNPSLSKDSESMRNIRTQYGDMISEDKTVNPFGSLIARFYSTEFPQEINWNAKSAVNEHHIKKVKSNLNKMVSSQEHYCSEINDAFKRIKQTLHLHKTEKRAEQLLQQEASMARDFLKFTENMSQYAECRIIFIEFLVTTEDGMMDCFYSGNDDSPGF